MNADARILVTGAAGFIGSHVAARLAGLGHAVVGCDNFNDYYAPALKHDRVAALLSPHGVSCENLELADGARVHDLFARVQPTHVVHLAAQAGVRYSLTNPDAYVQSNLVAYSHMLEACRRHQVAHFVYASSSSVYGASTQTPFREDYRTDAPVSLYAATKKSNELMAHCYSHLYRFPSSGLRFFTVYGPWGRPDMAYFSFTEKMLRGDAIPVFAGGELLRDFTYVDDIVEGVVRLLFQPPAAGDDGVAHAVFNIGNHRPVRVLDFIATLEKVLNVQARIDFQPMQAGDVPATFADTGRLQAQVGFAPATPLETGLARFRDWYLGWRQG